MSKNGVFLKLAATVAIAGAAVTFSGAGAPPARARPAQPASHLTVPTGLTALGSDVPLRGGGVQGSPYGVAWQVNGDIDGEPAYAAWYQSFAGGPPTQAFVTTRQPPHDPMTFGLTGHQLYAAAGEVGVDITTGQQLATYHDCMRTGAGCFTIDQVGINSDYHYSYTDDATGTTKIITPATIDGTSEPGDTVYVRAIDARGAVLQVYGTRTPLPATDLVNLTYLDFATGQYTQLDDTQYAFRSAVAMDADDVAWTHDGNAYYLDRADLSASPSPATGAGAGLIIELALNGPTLAYVTSVADHGIDGPHMNTVHDGPLGGSTFTTVEDAQSLDNIVPIDDGDFAAVAGTSIADFGLYRITPGQTGLGPVVALFGFAPLATPIAPDDFTATGASTTAVISPAHHWYIPGTTGSQHFGVPGDIPAVLDNQAGIAQLGVFRPSNATWYTRAGATLTKVHFGAGGDIPVAAHYQGDKQASVLAVFRPSTGAWYIRGQAEFAYGTRGDVPVPGHYYGTAANNYADQAAIFRPATGTWHLRGHASVAYGQKGDIPVPGNYTTATTQIAIYRPATQEWHIRGQRPVHYGAPGDIPVTGDFAGDGHTDIAVYRPSTHTWWIHGIGPVVYGSTGDTPVGRAPHTA